MTAEREDGGHWFEAVADDLGSAYLRYSFTKGTVQEVTFLIDALGLEPGDRVLDVGCGPGRHAHELARRGLTVHGVDISDRFVELARDGAPAGATFEVTDARHLEPVDEYDAAISLCQGAFGLAGGPAAAQAAPGVVDPDGEVLVGMARAVRPGGRVAVSAFSAYFQVRYPVPDGGFDADTGVHHEHTTVKDEAGADHPHDLWTSCFTPRELRLLARLCGLRVDAVHAVTPGDYAARRPDLEHPELLLLAAVPG